MKKLFNACKALTFKQARTKLFFCKDLDEVFEILGIEVANAYKYKIYYSGGPSGMKIFTEMAKRNFEEVVFISDNTSGLRAIIAIHDTTLGPALGGTRMWNYASDNAAF